MTGFRLLGPFRLWSGQQWNKFPYHVLSIVTNSCSSPAAENVRCKAVKGAPAMPHSLAHAEETTHLGQLRLPMLRRMSRHSLSETQSSGMLRVRGGCGVCSPLAGCVRVGLFGCGPLHSCECAWTVAREDSASSPGMDPNVGNNGGDVVVGRCRRPVPLLWSRRCRRGRRRKRIPACLQISWHVGCTLPWSRRAAAVHETQLLGWPQACSKVKQDNLVCRPRTEVLSQGQRQDETLNLFMAGIKRPSVPGPNDSSVVDESGLFHGILPGILMCCCFTVRISRGQEFLAIVWRFSVPCHTNAGLWASRVRQDPPGHRNKPEETLFHDWSHCQEPQWAWWAFHAMFALLKWNPCNVPTCMCIHGRRDVPVLLQKSGLAARHRGRKWHASFLAIEAGLFGSTGLGRVLRIITLSVNLHARVTSPDGQKWPDTKRPAQ